MTDPRISYALILLGASSSFALLCALAISGRFCKAPAFTAFLLFECSTAIAGLVTLGARAYYTVYSITTVLEWLFELAVAWELCGALATFVHCRFSKGAKATATVVLVASVLIGLPLRHDCILCDNVVLSDYLFSYEITFYTAQVVFFGCFLRLAYVCKMKWTHIPVKIGFCLTLHAVIGLTTRIIQQMTPSLHSSAFWIAASNSIEVATWSILMLTVAYQFRHRPTANQGSSIDLPLELSDLERAQEGVVI